MTPVMSSSNWAGRAPRTNRASKLPSRPRKGRSWMACAVKARLPAKVSGSRGTRSTEDCTSLPSPSTSGCTGGNASPRLCANNSGNRVTSTMSNPSRLSAPSAHSTAAASVPAAAPLMQTSSSALREGAKPSRPQVRPRAPNVGEGKKKPPRTFTPFRSAAASRAASCRANTARMPTPIGSKPTTSSRVAATPSTGLYVASATEPTLSPDSWRKSTARATVFERASVATQEKPTPNRRKGPVAFGIGKSSVRKTSSKAFRVPGISSCSLN
mmetsp:Transcript_42738/g.98945  ORF Transcript_42738/g.98945 Transcript_42738/m.98945 type:complete len:270 (+) Transcript_42738:323-1132(+)